MITQHSRPYWHVDAKWITGLVATLVLSVFLIVFGLFRLTDQSSAPKFATALVTSLAQQGKADINASELKTKLQPLYEKGPDTVAQSLGQKADGPLGALSLFTKKSHQQLGVASALLGLTAVLLLSVLVYFSHRFGRLVSPGIVLLFASKVGAIVLLTFGTAKDSSGPKIASFGPDVLHLIGDAFLPAYLVATTVGVLLLIAALVLKLTHRAID